MRKTCDFGHYESVNLVKDYGLVISHTLKLEVLRFKALQLMTWGIRFMIQGTMSQ